MYVSVYSAWYTQKPEDVIRFLRAGVTGSQRHSAGDQVPVLSFFFFFFVFFFFCLFVFFRDRVSLYSPGCPGAHFVDQAGLELRNPPASASRVLGLKAWATTPGVPVLSRAAGVLNL